MQKTRFVSPAAKSLLLLAMLIGSSAQAAEVSLLAENGSERTLERIRKQQERPVQELAAGGSDRLIERIRALDEKRKDPSASVGNDRAPVVVNT
jgi:hypothetical protein